MFSHRKDTCYLYEYPRPTYIKDCEKLEDQIRFYIWKEFSQSVVDYRMAQSLALYRPVKLSSTYFWKISDRRIYAFGNISVDGNVLIPSLKIKQEVYCSITQDEAFPWWRVDLSDPYMIVEVTIFESKEKPNPVHDIEVRVGATDIAALPISQRYGHFLQNQLCLKVKGQLQSDDGVHFLECARIVPGRYLTIQITQSCPLCKTELEGNYLALCQVFAWGYPITTTASVNRAYLQPVFISSTVAEANCKGLGCNPKETGFSHRITDGVYTVNTSRNVSSTSPTPDKPVFTPWMQVDLWSEFEVHTIIVLNRYGRSAVRLHHMVIRVGNERIGQQYESQVFERGSLCFASPGDTTYPEGFNYFACNTPVSGRYVSIQITKPCPQHLNDCSLPSSHRNILNLQEIYIFGQQHIRFVSGDDLAIQKPTLQSSIENHHVADLAVQGHLLRSVHNESTRVCTKTRGDDRLPWWRVDLISNYVVTAVGIYTPDNEMQGFFGDLEIRVGFLKIEQKRVYEVFRKNPLCAIIKGTARKALGGGWNKFYCPIPLHGRYVSLQVTTYCKGERCLYEGASLSLCDVYVFGQSMLQIGEIINLALQQKTSQSTTFSPEMGSTLAVDGDWNVNWKNNGTFKCTYNDVQFESDLYPWWQVELKTKSLVLSVSIYHLGHSNIRPLHDLEVRVGYTNINSVGLGRIFTANPLCGEWKEGYIPREWVHLSCLKPLIGIYVSIQIVQSCPNVSCLYTDSNVLSLCEVEVWGQTNYKEEDLKNLNVALLQPSTQSSSALESSIASYANDGSFRSNVMYEVDYQLGLFKTNPDSDGRYPWWLVDLVGTYDVTAVTITDFHLELSDMKQTVSPLTDFRIGVGNTTLQGIISSSVVSLPVCIEVTDTRLRSGVNLFKCKIRMRGRYVSLEVTKCTIQDCTQSKNILWPKEIQVISDSAISKEVMGRMSVVDKNNLAAYKMTAESSYYASPYYAIDWTKANGSEQKFLLKHCAITQKAYFPWWRVDLAEMYMVERVNVDYKVTFKGQAYYPAIEIRVGCTDIVEMSSRELINANSPCRPEEKPKRHRKLSPSTGFDCKPVKQGRYVSLQFMGICKDREKPYGDCWFQPTRLILCGFDIFGKKPEDYVMPLAETITRDGSYKTGADINNVQMLNPGDNKKGFK